MKKTLILTSIILLLAFNTAAQSTQNVNIELKKTEPVPLQSSEYADVWLEVTNDGTSSAKNVNISFAQNYPFTSDPDEKTSWQINELTPGEEYQLRLQVRVDENAVQGSNNTINFRARHGGTTFLEKVPVEVRSDNNILSVENVEFPDTVPPGNSGDMSINLRNLADGQLKNIEVSLDVSGDSKPFATSMSSTKNMEELEPGQNRSIDFTLEIDESAENGVYKLPIEFDYENEAGTSFESSTTTGVVVGGRPELETGLNNENQISPGSTETLTFRVINRGYGSADFVQMRLEPTENYEVLSPETVYLGDMDSDDFQTAEYQIYVKSNASDLSAPVELSFNDRNGEMVETQMIEMPVYSQQELQERGLAADNSRIPLIVGAVLAVIIILYLWRRRRKKKR